MVAGFCDSEERSFKWEVLDFLWVEWPLLVGLFGVLSVGLSVAFEPVEG